MLDNKNEIKQIRWEQFIYFGKQKRVIKIKIRTMWILSATKSELKIYNFLKMNDMNAKVY